ncbi:SDR family oxidoreductase [Clostridium estertheticum]|uniref:SDR family oxidoreductase n=1 Tax=Clostridium estertheticum TaxID=238834 RepID=UPI001CF1150D|nr:SDR family oxidoreductase [Clostridium estertheticum]MCB2353447.1 SDR family oxidoreductase [Clostridium estertheticum]WAG41788.1 SDR family oxidoreductase [Clostridium estertheticum]
MEIFLEKFSLKGKKAIVTGGTKGLGYGMAEGLLEAGCEVAIIGSSDKTMSTAAAFVEEGYKCHGIKADLRNTQDNYRAFDECLAALDGNLDILITAAGIQRRHRAEVFPIDEWDEVMSINLRSVFIMCQLAGKTMLKQSSGRIINIASMTSFFGSEMIPAYAASKGGIAQLTKALSNEWSSKGVNVNAIAPGYMVTKLTADMKEKNPKQYEEITGRIPKHRWGQAEDLKGLSVFLSSEASSYITGAIIPVDGGYLGK